LSFSYGTLIPAKWSPLKSGLITLAVAAAVSGVDGAATGTGTAAALACANAIMCPM
jgi:hypothetical protein